MQIIEQKVIQALIPNEGILCSAKMGMAIAEFEKSVDAGCPFIFLDTNDWGVVNQLLMRYITSPNKTFISEYLHGKGNIGNSFFEQMSDNSGFITYEERKNSDTDLYNLIFDFEAESSRFVILRGFSRLIEEKPFVIDWFLKAATHQHNTTDLKQRRIFIIAEPYVSIPSLLLPCSAKIVLPKPDEKEIQNIFETKFSEPQDYKYEAIYNEFKNPDKRRAVFSNLLGFSQTEIEYLFDYAVKGTPKQFENTIKAAKTSLAAKAACLQLVDAKNDDFGGMENLKEHMKNVAKLLSHRNVFFNAHLPCPKGILLVGMPGCGKSLAAKTSATILNRPLLQLDFGKILGKHVGESELNFRTALDIAEKSSPCVLWIDELEKAFAGLEDSNGVTKRLFGYFLTWMQESVADVYIVATANNISKIPPEFKRKGRFDKIFSIHMPSKNEREKIFQYHLSKLDKAGMLVNGIIDKCKDYAEKTSYCIMSSSCKDNDDRGVSGADIASIIQNALSKAIIRSEKENLKNIKISNDDMIEAIKEIQGHTQRDIMKKQVVTETQDSNTDGYKYLEKFLNDSGYVSASKE